MSVTQEIKSIFGREVPIIEREYNKQKTAVERFVFVLEEVILKNGLLLDEDILVIRLGIDRHKSKDWNNLLTQDVFHSFAYTTKVFNTTYIRWWQKYLLDWWKSVHGTNIKIVDASERVAFLKQYFDLHELVALQKSSKHRYNTFWYKCQLSNFPLETADGLRTVEMPRYFWQEPSYISKAYLWSDECDNEKVMPLLDDFDIDIFNSIQTLKKRKNE